MVSQVTSGCTMKAKPSQQTPSPRRRPASFHAAVSSVPTTAMSFGNPRGTLTTADTAASAGITLASGVGSLRLAAPGGGRSGTYDVALSLGSSANDASCLQSWTPGVGDAASAGANLAFLRGNFCSTTYSNDPAARATFGRQRGVDSLVYRRENF
jgi:hypothetical protein